MNILTSVCLVVLLATLAPEASAESLRCNGRIASVGDSRLSLLYKCGSPLLADRFCAPVFYSGSLHPVPEPFASAFVPCQPVEEWLYERGAGNLVATVRLRSGIVESITYGQSSR